MGFCVLRIGFVWGVIWRLLTLVMIWVHSEFSELKWACVFWGLGWFYVLRIGFVWGVIWRLLLSVLIWVHCEFSKLKWGCVFWGLVLFEVCFGGSCFQLWHGFNVNLVIWNGFVCFEDWLRGSGYLEIFGFTFDYELILRLVNWSGFSVFHALLVY